MTVGILALQGAFREHEQMLQRIGVPTQQVRLPEHLEKVDRLIIPGGESTTIGKLLVLYNLLEPVRQRALDGMPLWGTCAGGILMAKTIADGRAGQPNLGLLDMTARRNAFGRQIDSFEVDLSIPQIGELPLRAVFIRAPLFEEPGADVEVLASLEDGRLVAAQQRNLLATSFHPELTQDDRLHRYFLEM
jgi:5'-phosphate synthase pdxT subunit